ncbi:MAG: hypothetical protein UMR38_07445 [Candidatus Izemoplasma sp.]|nr:hypothetical protein [Candidatus Izemoplasma sp.]
MSNPFKENGYMLPIASINNTYVDDDKVSDLFQLSLIKEAILAHKDQLGLNELETNKHLLERFNECIQSEVPSIRKTSLSIAQQYGERLAKILCNFFNPSQRTLTNQSSWDKEHWEYWQNIERVYLVGGITSPILTKLFFNEIKRYFKSHSIDKEVIFIAGSQHLGTKGLSTLVKEGEYLLFDFGQTMIKRRHHIKEHGETKVDIILNPVHSKYLFYKDRDKEELLHVAKKLHNYIVKVIVDTANEVAFEGSNMHIAIANYLNDGKIYPNRGGYAKLAKISSHYESHISQELSQALGRKINVILHHDTSAMALNFKNEEQIAVLSVGTAFGVAFPD